MTSGFDLPRFEQFLSELTRSLLTPGREQQTDTATTVSDQEAQIIAALHALGRAVAGHAFRESPTMPNVMYEPAAGVFRSACGSITDALRREASSVIAPHHRTLMGKLLEQQFPDFLALVGKERDENSHSSVLRWLLDPNCAPNIARHALVKLVQRLDESDRWVRLIEDAIANGCLSVRREVTLGSEGSLVDKLDRIDLLISGPTFLLAVENKVDSEEHEGQTQGYWNWLEDRRSARPKNFHAAGIFLTPLGSPARCSKFKTVSYLYLAACLLDSSGIESLTPNEQAVLSGYVQTLRRHVLGPEVDMVERTTWENPR